QGQGLTGFQGAPGPEQLKDFLSRLAEAVGIQGAPGQDGPSLEQAIEMAETMLAEGQFEDALQTFAAIVAEDGANPRALAGLARSLLAAGRIDEAKATLDNAPAEIAADPAVSAARAAIELASASAAATGEIAVFERTLAADPNDHEARLGLADALIGAGQNEEAVDHLLEAFRRDREWNDGAAKAKLLTLIESLGPKDPLAGRARRRLSSLIFA
ncbi:MAG: tetratricopeptide repeat protein, partial [Pseudomonadota bacterium]